MSTIQIAGKAMMILLPARKPINYYCFEIVGSDGMDVTIHSQADGIEQRF
jgi:hypothetical protein